METFYNRRVIRASHGTNTNAKCTAQISVLQVKVDFNLRKIVKLAPGDVSELHVLIKC